MLFESLANSLISKPPDYDRILKKDSVFVDENALLKKSRRTNKNRYSKIKGCQTSTLTSEFDAHLTSRINVVDRTTVWVI